MKPMIKKFFIFILVTLILSVISLLPMMCALDSYEYKIKVRMLDNEIKTFTVRDPKTKPKIIVKKNDLYSLTKCECDTVLLVEGVKSAVVFKEHIKK